MTPRFEWESTRQIQAIHIGPQGYLIYSVNGGKRPRTLRFEVWCFHLSVSDQSLSFPVSGSSVTCSKLKSNGQFLLTIASNAFTLKLNITNEPTEDTSITEFPAGLSIENPEADRATSPEIVVLLDWLITAHSEVKIPLPGLTAVDLISDAIDQYLALSFHTVNRKACSRLKHLINKFMDYDITTQMYLKALVDFKKDHD